MGGGGEFVDEVLLGKNGGGMDRSFFLLAVVSGGLCSSLSVGGLRCTLFL